MPQGQGRITRQNYEDLIKWFDEGNTFDGDDPRAPLASYVPSEGDLAAARFAAMSPEEFLAHRREQAESLWKRTLPNDPHATIERDQFLLIGNVSEERLNQVGDWADEQLIRLRRMFNTADNPIWKGKLLIVVFKERFGLNEYAISTLNQEAPEGMYGDVQVSPSLSDGYIVLQDVGNEATVTSPDLKASLIEFLTGAWLQRGGTLPDWVVRGVGLSLAAQSEPANVYLKGLAGQAARAVTGLNRPADLFDEGTFSPAEIGPIGYAIVETMLAESESQNLVQLIKRLHAGATMDVAFRDVYGVEPGQLAQLVLVRLRKAAAR